MKRFGEKLIDLHSYNLNAQKNWPQIFGYYVTINYVTPNQGGTKKASTKFRKRPQANILSNNAEAETEFNRFFSMKLDEDEVNQQFIRLGGGLFQRLKNSNTGGDCELRFPRCYKHIRQN
jgi:hypothetical protein